MKRLEQKQGELSGLLIAVEANDKLKAKFPEVQAGLKTLGDLLTTYKRMQVLLDVNLASMSGADCAQEKDNVAQHLDGVNALFKKIKGWLA